MQAFHGCDILRTTVSNMQTVAYMFPLVNILGEHYSGVAQR